MHVHIEIIFRPRNRFHRFLAWWIGAPTVGIVRAFEDVKQFGVDDYIASAILVAPDHKRAEVKALASPVTFSMYTCTKREAALIGLKIHWKRRKPGGRIVEIDPK